MDFNAALAMADKLGVNLWDENSGFRKSGDKWFYDDYQEIIDAYSTKDQETLDAIKGRHQEEINAWTNAINN